VDTMQRTPLARAVIVADDDVVMRGVLRSLFASVGQDVFLAATGDEATMLASKTKAKLVLLDLGMPGLNGLKACSRIRALPGYRSTPIVMLTAHNGSEPRLAAARVGATLFIPKPFRPAALLATLAPFLELDENTQEIVSRGARRAFEIATPPAEPEPASTQPTARTADILDKGRMLLSVYR
jgi:CheY-like chemotaxis protein